MNLASLAMRRPVTVFMIVLSLLVLGSLSITRIKIAFLPDVDFPFIGVFVPYPNAIPTQVEREIAKPIEEVLATLGDIKDLFSESNAQGCFVGVEFDFGRDVNVMRLDVQERLDQVRADLPDDVQDLFLFTFNSNDIPIMVGRISAKGRDLAGSYDLLERRIIKPLERLDGVGRVQVDGIAPREISIYLKMDAIKAHSVDVGRVFAQLNSNNVNLSVGRVTRGGMHYNLRTLGAFSSVAEIEDLVISDAGLTLKDIADIEESEPEAQWYRRLNGESAIAFEIQKASGANVVDVSRAVHAELDRIGRDPALEGVDVVLFFDQADEIVESLNNLLSSGLLGSLLAVLILYFCLRNVRSTMVVSIAIPFSVVATCVFLYLTGRTLNLLTMMGLMLAVGMLVDNAIVVLEAIFQRHLRGERGQAASLAGTADVGLAVTASTLTSIIVFAPIVLGGNDEITTWLREVGVTLSVTLIFSLLVSLTLVPLMQARLKPAKIEEPSQLMARWQRQYVRVLHWTTIQHPMRTLGLLGLLIVMTVGLVAATGFKAEPFDDRAIKTNRLRISLVFQDNVNVYKADETVQRVEAYLLPRADSLGAEVYSFFSDNRGEVTLFFDRTLKAKDLRALRQQLRKGLPVLAGSTYEFGEEDSGDKGAQRLQVRVFGEDSELLEELAQEVKRRLALVEDLHDVRTNAEQGRQEVHVVVNREKASRFGVNPSNIAGILDLTFRGMDLREVQASDREVPMSLQLDPDDRRSLENLARMTIDMQDGKDVMLEQVADFRFKRTPTSIQRDGQRTASTVTASYEGKEFGKTRDRVAELMNSLALPNGYSWSFGREDRQSQQEANKMGQNIQLALACVYFVMAALFESLLHPMVIMLTVPFAIIGVIWLLVLTNTPLNIMAMIGLVVLIGVIVNNGIILISHINELRRRGHAVESAILTAGRERFRPIFMTASTTVLGLLPLALGETAMSSVQYFPMARTLIGGLISGTILTLIVLPTFYVLAERQFAWARHMWGESARFPLRLPRRRRAASATD
ncbi:MAG TPA: efflux RND transporter permease subunit [Candidatus Krumholzibacteria bacterium]|nr:efflux RND transporter permease subunit [Candidatus Krumholzibacteria bacterium]